MGWAGEPCGRRDVAGLTDQTLSCTARALVPKPERRAARCMWGARMRAAWRRDDFDAPRRLGRRAEAGPCQLLRRVSRRELNPSFNRRRVPIQSNW